MGKFVDLTDMRFGKLYVIRREGLTSDKKHAYLCRCDCGTERIFSGGNLRMGHSRSCGCVSKQRIGQLNFSHGLYKHPLYKVWYNIIKRCTQPQNQAYKNYGGRGIKIFFTCFEDFYNFAINNGWAKGLEIDRIDNDGPYSRDNCRFVTRAENSRNTRKNLLVTHPVTGARKCAAEWSRELGGQMNLVSKRITQRGWSPERAITTLPRRTKHA